MEHKNWLDLIMMYQKKAGELTTQALIDEINFNEMKIRELKAKDLAFTLILKNRK